MFICTEFLLPVKTCKILLWFLAFRPHLYFSASKLYLTVHPFSTSFMNTLFSEFLARLNKTIACWYPPLWKLHCDHLSWSFLSRLQTGYFLQEPFLLPHCSSHQWGSWQILKFLLVWSFRGTWDLEACAVSWESPGASPQSNTYLCLQF